MRPNQSHLSARWTSASLAVLLAWLQCVPPAFCAEFTVFKKTYVRDADSPDTVVDAVNVLNPSTSWALRAVNGSLEDTLVEKVSSSTLKLNGADVLQPSHFSQNTNLIAVPITLLASNTVSTQVRSKPGGQLSVQIVGQDTTPPSAVWLAPLQEQFFNTDAVTATLRIADDIAGLDPASLSILLDGSSVRPAFSSFTQPALMTTLEALLRLSEGAHTLSASVRDLAGQSVSAAASFVVDLTPPALAAVHPAHGEVVTIPRPTISAAFQDALSGVNLTTVRLLLDGVDVTALTEVWDGSLAFQPQTDLSDGAHAIEIRMQDRAGNLLVSQVAFTVQTIQHPPITPASGFIHGLVLNAATDAPLADATITIRGLSGEVRSGADGRYQIPTPDSGEFVVNIERTSFTSVQRKVTALSGRDVAVEQAFLTPLDPKITLITAEQGGVATDSSGEFQVQFPAGATPRDLQVRVTPLHDERQLPGPFPKKDWAHIEAVFFEPRFTAFEKPATFRHRNRQGFAGGTSIVLSLWDEDNQRWLDAGTGQVSADGQWIEFPIVRFFCWYCTRLPRTTPPQAENPDPEDAKTKAEVWDPKRTCEVEGSSTVCSERGDLSITHTLPVLRTLGQSRSLTFTYHSMTADPSVLIGTDYLLETVSKPGDAGTLVPITTSTVIQVEGQRVQASFIGTAGSTHQAFLWDGRNARGERVPTGAYPFTIELSNDYPSTFGTTGIPTGDRAALTTTVNRHAILINQRDSPFGAGWGLEDLQRLWPQPDGTVLVTAGDGSATLFHQGPMADLVVANYLSNDVSVLFGHNDGTFQPQQRLIVGPIPPVVSDGLPYGVAVGEFNGDGFQDVAVTLIRTGEVAIFLGRGAAFAPPQRVPVGQAPFSVTVADCNGDGRQDLLISNLSSNSVSLLLGNGDGTFQPEQRVPVGMAPAAIAVGDFNQDGALDFATANGGDWTPYGVVGSDVSVVLGNGDGTFQPERRLSVGRGSRAILAEDFNGDSLSDLAITNVFDDDISVLVGNGDGTFQPQQRFPGVPSSFNGIAALAVGDFNGDAKRDLIETSLDTANVALLLGNGDGTFQPRRQISAGGPPYSVAVADVNQDGAQDLALTNGTIESSVLLGNGDGTFQRPLWFSVGTYPAGIAVGEFNDRADNSAQTFTGLPGDFSQLKRNPDGTFVRLLTDGLQFHFDAQGFHKKTVDRNGNETRYTYDVQNRLSRIEFPGGATFDFAYDPSNGHLASVTDSNGRTTQFLINGDGNLSKITDPNGATRQLAYDTEHRLRAQTNERGFTTDYVYDDFGRLQEARLPERPVFDPTGDTITPQREIRHFFPSDTQGLINALPSGVGSPENPAAPLPTPLASFQDGRGNTVQLSTDRYGAPTKVVDPLGRTTTIARDVNGLPTKITRPNGGLIEMAYDGRGNLVSVREDAIHPNAPQFPQRIVYQFEYDPTFNQVTKIIDARRDSPFDPFQRACPAGCTTRIEYDDQGNPIHIVDHEGNITSFTYDSRGLLLSATDPLGTATSAIPDDHQTRFTYDPVTGNLLTTTDPLARTTSLTYDAAGNIKTTTDAALHATTFTYDTMNQLLSVQDADGKTTAYAYDAGGNLIQVTDANTHTTTFAYDALNLLSSTTNPATQTKQFFYDASRNLTRLLDAKGQTIDFRYDAANQLTTKLLKDAAEILQDTVTYDYDSLGNVTLIQDADSKLTFAYDSTGRVVRAATGDATNPAFAQPAITVQYSYDPNGNRISLSTMGLRYAYDGLNRLTTVFAQNLFGRSFEYDALSRMTRLSGGPVSTFTYDDASQLLNLNTTLLGNPLEAFAYAYDPLGNRMSLTDRFGLHQYGYDALSRLMSADHPLASLLPDETFTYDPVGNRRTSHRSATHLHDAANRLLEDDQFAYTYDANGNRTAQTDKTDPTVRTLYTYDVENQLFQIDLPDGRLARYRYDGLGRRIEKTINGVITRYLYDQEDIVALFTGPTNCQTQAFLHGPGLDQPLAFLRDTNSDCNPFADAVGFREPIVYLQRDGLGSTTSLVSETDGFFRGLFLAERYTYDSFGTPHILGPGPDGQFDTADDVPLTASALGNPYLFTGREYDPESGLYFYRARSYDPRTGTFLQEDPVGLMGAINLYRYALNDPVNRVDPFGLVSIMRPGGIHILADPVPDIPSETAIVDVIDEQGPAILNDPPSTTSGGAGIVVDPPTPVGGTTLCETTSKQKEVIERPGGTTEIETRGTPGADGGRSRVVKIKNTTGKTTGVWHEVRDKQGRVIHRHWKGPNSPPTGFKEVK